MISYIFSTLIVYILIILGLWASSSIDGTVGSILFWILFLLSSLISINLFKYIREFFIVLFAKCHEIDPSYIDKVMKEHQDSKKVSID